MTNYNIFLTTPSIGSDADSQPTSLGTEFLVNQECWVTQLRWLRPFGSDSAIRKGALFEKPGIQVSDIIDLPMPDYSTWGAVDITPIKLAPGKRYVVVVFHPAGRYAATGGYFTTGANSVDTVRGPITIPRSSATSAQGSYIYRPSLSYPTETYNGAAYYSDVTITDVDPNPSAEGTEIKVRTVNGWDNVRVAPKYYTETGWETAQLKYRGATQWNI